MQQRQSAKRSTRSKPGNGFRLDKIFIPPGKSSVHGSRPRSSDSHYLRMWERQLDLVAKTISGGFQLRVRTGEMVAEPSPRREGNN